MLAAGRLDFLRGAQGCPDPDNDQDTICDPWVADEDKAALYAGACGGKDTCPMVPEDRDDFEDGDGCPDPDNDKDKVLDPWVAEKGLLATYAELGRGSDECPLVPEDIDGHKDADGCPDPDNDQDRICDPWVVDQGLGDRYKIICKGPDECPDEPEDYDGDEDDDGCPDAKARIEGKRIVLLEKILFFYNKSKIKPESYPILDEVLGILLTHPEIKRVRIEGHTDTRGGARYNERLSHGRAREVHKYLTTRGVDPDRLRYQGFGELKPLVFPEKGEADWQMNRRVEFVILEADPIVR